MKNFSVLIIVLCVSMVFTGCQNANPPEQHASSENGSFQGLLFVNGQIYLWDGGADPNEYQIKEKIGKVKTKTPPETFIKENFSSNFLKEGTEIYTVEGNKKILISKTDDIYRVFRLTEE